ncbi:MAG: acyl-CoA dehydrogenase [Acidobacteriota bacterium]
MNFQLSEEHSMLKQTIRAFAEKEIKPKAAEHDKTREYPFENVRKAAGLNLMGIMIPEEYGGGGMDCVSYVIAVEEISRCCASTGVIISVNNSLYCHPVLFFGTEEQKRKYLSPCAKGEKIGAFCLTEANAGSDAGNQQSTAVFKGDRYILNGTKLFVTNGVAADYMIIFAMTDRGKKTKGISAFIVEKDFSGLTKGKDEVKLGITCSGACEIVLENCEVPSENLLGKEGDGFKIAMNALEEGRIGIASQAVGIAQAILDESLKYSKERVQFGKPISEFQAIQWMLSDMATEIEAARLLNYRAAMKRDSGAKYTLESSMAKLFASEVAMKSAIKGIQIFGGYGYINEYPMERFFRDAKITEIYEGTSEIQRLIISGLILKGN